MGLMLIIMLHSDRGIGSTMPSRRMLGCAAGADCRDHGSTDCEKEAHERPCPEPRPAVAGLPAYVAGRKASGPNVAALASNESHYPAAAEGAGCDRRRRRHA